MMPLPIRPGTRVLVRTADNQLLARRAITGVVTGEDFPVVWVCREELWSPNAKPTDEGAVPWPSEAVQIADHADGADGHGWRHT